MPIYKLLDEMTYEEIRGWFNYFDQRPFGWQDDKRAALIMQSFGAKVDPTKIFTSLEKLSKAVRSKENFIDSFRRSAMFQFVSNSTGGDKLEILNG